MGAASETNNCHLKVTVHKCSNLKDTNPRLSSILPGFMKQDPYVSLEHAGTKFRTKTCHGGHKDPTFGQQTFLFPRTVRASDPLNIEVWDKDFFTHDDFIGKASIPHAVLSKCNGEMEYSLQDGAGKIHLNIEWQNEVNALVNH